ncbi:G8 domain-containing protein [Polaribacter tangerinus]|uniref:G8 domain-containing protein n=1 Tax=Polaribacter tangerinus TaxID=1920034 RepID=UPI000B4A9654|nr:G8 domain-containing protein [Polaribacter tangerinus]
MKKNIVFISFIAITFLISSFTKVNSKTNLIGFKYYCETNITVNAKALSSGDWSNSSIWSSGKVPSINDVVHIPSGLRVTMSGSIEAYSVRVDGVLSPKTLMTDFTLTTKGVMIHSGGLFQVGSETNPYKGKGLITLIGSNSSELLMPSSPIMGSKIIGVMDGGRLELHGNKRKTWTQLNATALKGVSTITLKEEINWRVGDEIVIASTDFDPHQAEKRTITSVNGLNLTLDAPLNYMHFGVEQVYNNGTRDIVLDERAEVGLLTHNLKIQGDSNSEINGFGGHIMSMPNSVSKASNIELYRMGQKSKVGKYPWHWHLLGDQGSGQYIKNAGIHRSYNRIITVHGTNNTLVEGNVGYDFLGHGYFLENGSETGNLFKNNLGVLCKRPKEGEETTPHDIGKGAGRGAHPEAFPATFWITNPDNDFIGNVSAGSDGSGFWHLILKKVLDGPDSSYEPGIQPMGIFDDNKAHSNLFSWGVDGGVDRDTDEIVNGHYRPRNADGSNFIPVINRFDGYKSVDRNVWIRANTMNFYDCDFGDNGRADFFSYNQTLYNSLIVGKSANIGNPESDSEIEAGRTLPYPEKSLDDFHNGFRGHSIYDGPSGIVNTHFDGFNQEGAKSYCFQINGASRKSTNHFARGITYGSDVTDDAKFDFDHNSYFSYMYLSGLIDEDGSLTGEAGTNVRPIIVSNPRENHLYEKGANTQMTDAIEKVNWGAWLTKGKTYNYYKDTDFTEKNNGAFTPRYFITEYPDKTSHAVYSEQTQQLYFDAPVITNDLNYTYYMQYHKLPTYMVGQVNGAKTITENVIIAYPNIPSIAYGGNAKRVFNMAELKQSKENAYLIKDNTIYFKHITNKTQNTFFQRQFGSDFKYESNSIFICNAGNCFDSNSWGNVLDKVTLIDYGVRSENLRTIETNNDSRDSASSTDGLNVPEFKYVDRRVNFTIENNGNGISGYTDYIITLTSRQVWEFFNTLTLNYSGPDVNVIVESENGKQFSLGTYSDSDSQNIRIGQDSQFNQFTNVKKIILRFHEEAIGNINTSSVTQVSINNILLGIDVPDKYSLSSSFVDQDTDGDGVLDSLEAQTCRNGNSASDFAIEFDSNDRFFDNYKIDFVADEKNENGTYQGRSLSRDPKIIVSDFVSINSDDIKEITLRYKANISSTRVQLFWSTAQNSSFGAARSIFTNYTGNGEWQELKLDVSKILEWKNKIITGFRLDPTNSNNITFEIDWLRAQEAEDPINNCKTASTNDNYLVGNKLVIFPNPVLKNNLINFEGIENDKLDIQVFDINGKKVRILKANNSFKLINASSGIYFVKFVINSKTIINKKIIVK